MSTDTLDLPPIDTTPIAAAAQVPAVATSGGEISALAKATVRDAALLPMNALAPGLRAVTERYRAVAFDLKTPKGLQAAKDARHDLRKNGRFLVQNTRDELKDLLNDAKTAVEAKAVELIAITQPREDELHKDIEAREAEVKAEKAEAARIAAEKAQKQADGVASIRAYLSRAQTAADMTAERVGKGIALLEAMTFSADEWLDPVAAANAQCETLEGMRALHTTLQAREEAAAAAEAQRLENERVAAELAEQKRKADAEQKRIAGCMARIAEIRAAATGHERATAADLYEARVAVAALDVSEASYAEFTGLAEATQAATLAALDGLRNKALEREEAAVLAATRATLTPAPAPYAPPPFAGYAGHPVYNPENPPPEFNEAPAPTGEGRAVTPGAGNAEAAPNSEGQDDPQVLKAEPATADATAGSVPADASPRVGAMGAGQAADAAPAAEIVQLRSEHQKLVGTLIDAGVVKDGLLPEPTMTLGEFNTYIAPLRIDGAGLESLGFPAAGRRKAAMLYHEADRPRMVAAMVKHLQGL